MREIIDIVSKRYKDFEVWQEKKIIRVVEKSDEGNKKDYISSLNIAIRVFEQGRRGFVYLSGENYQEDLIFDNLKFSLESSFLDEANILPLSTIKDTQEFRTEEKSYGSESLDNKVKTLLESQREYREIKKIERVTVSGEEVEINLYNSRVGMASQVYQKYSMGVVLVLSKDGDEKVEWDYAISDDLKDLDENAIFLNAYNRGVKLLNSSPPNSGRYVVLMENRSACDFLEVLSKSFVAENLFKKKSLFDEGGKLSPLLNINEDPLVSYGSYKYFFDGEGFVTSSKSLMRDGVVVDLLYDNFFGVKFGKKSNGGSVRRKIALPPQNSYTNIYISPAEKDNITPLLKELEDVIVIVSLIGMHLVNPVTGEFSVGFEGYLLRKGEFAKSLSGCTISGNIKDIFSNILALGRDLKFYGNTGSPSILFSEIAVSGV